MSKASKHYRIDDRFPIPLGKRNYDSRLERIRRALTAMAEGRSHSFLYADGPISHVYRLAKQMQIKITVRKINNEGFRVWRI